MIFCLYHLNWNRSAFCDVIFLWFLWAGYPWNVTFLRWNKFDQLCIPPPGLTGFRGGFLYVGTSIFLGSGGGGGGTWATGGASTAGCGGWRLCMSWRKSPTVTWRVSGLQFYKEAKGSVWLSSTCTVYIYCKNRKMLESNLMQS